MGRRRGVRFREIGAFVKLLSTVACVAVLALASLVLAPAVSGAAAHHSKASGTPIVIGHICSCTGPLASTLVAEKPAFAAWVDSVNAHGGVAGHPLDVIYLDDASSPTTAVTGVQKMLTQDHIAALVDDSNEETDFGTMVEDAHVPIIEADSSSLLYTSPDDFTPSQTVDSVPTAVVEAAKRVGAKSFGDMYCAESPVCSELNPVLKSAGAKIGVPLNYSTAISASAPNYVAQCLAAKTAGIQALFVGDAVAPTLSVGNWCQKQGFNDPLIAEDGAVASSFRTAPGWDNGMIAFQPDIPFFVHDTPATETMYAAWKKYSPGLLGSSTFNELAVEGYAAGLLLGAAIEGAKVPATQTVSSADILRGLYTIHNNTLGGISPPLTFVPGKAHTVDCWFWMRTKNSQWTTPYGLTPYCAPDA